MPTPSIVPATTAVAEDESLGIAARCDAAPLVDHAPGLAQRGGEARVERVPAEGKRGFGQHLAAKFRVVAKPGDLAMRPRVIEERIETKAIARGTVESCNEFPAHAMARIRCGLVQRDERGPPTGANEPSGLLPRTLVPAASVR